MMFLGRSYLDVISEKDRERVQKHFNEVMDGKTRIYDLSYPSESENLLHVQVSTAPLFDDAKVIGLLGISRDVTERKQVEEALRESEEKYRLLFENSPVGIFVYNTQLRFVNCNDKYLTMLSTTRDRIIGLDLTTLKDPIALPVFQLPLEGKCGSYEGPYHTTTSDIVIWISVYTAPLYDREGRIVGGIGIQEDITERKQIEKALQESEEQFRVAQELSPDGFTILRPIRDAVGRVVDFTWVYENATIARLNGTEPNAVVGRRLLELFPRHRDSQFLRAYQQVAEKGESCTFEESYCGETISERTWFRIAVVPTGGDIAILAQDVTDRKRAEEALQKNLTLYRGLIETTDTGFVILDQKGKTLDANQEYVRLTGHENLSQIRGRSVVEWTADDEKEKNAEAVNRCFREGQIRNLEIDYVNAQGKITPVEINATVVKVGGVPQILTLCRDITDRKRAEEALKESESKYRNLIDQAWDAIFVIDSTGKMLLVNEQACKMLGYTQEELIRLNVTDTYLVEERAIAAQRIATAKRGDHLRYERSMVRKNGTIFPVEVTIGMLPNGMIQGIVRNITERKRAEEALRESEESYRTLVHNASDIVFKVDDTGYLTFVNPAALRVMGYGEKELIGKHYATLIRPDRRDEAMKFFGRQFVKKIENTYSEYPVVVKDGREIWLGQNTQLIFQDGKVVAFQAMARDITEMKQAEETIQQMAYHDSLTGLPNRKLFSDRLGIALAQAQRNQKGVAVTMLDLDNFKDVNDTLGHDVGDLLLKAAAERLSAALRKGDTITRFGGDEFALILPDLKGIEDAIHVAQKIVESFRKPFLIDTHQLIVTISIGIAVYPHDGKDADILLKNADIAMYQVKQTGRDRYQLCRKA
jgi:diguanylate cyclase (GGDEF)-like protein/PAS domain S-box-containing protein